jgi:hypothetical protein
LFWRQWHLKNSGLNGADISADRAWAIEKGSPQTVIAVLDGGFDMSHPDLQPNLENHVCSVSRYRVAEAETVL